MRKMTLLVLFLTLSAAVRAVVPTPADMRGPFPIMSTPYFEDGAVDCETLAKEAQWVDNCGCPGVIWCQSNDAVDLLTTAEKFAGFEACAKAVEGRPVTLALGANGTNTAQMLEMAVEIERVAARHPAAKVAMVSRPPDDVRSEEALEKAWDALGRVAKRPVIMQTFGTKETPTPSVEMLVRLAKRHPHCFGYVKEEAAGDAVLDRMRAENAAKPAIKSVFSGWGGWKWLIQMRQCGSVGLVTERCAVAPLLGELWRRYARGERGVKLAEVYAMYRLLIDQRDFPGGMRGYALYLLKKEGVFKNMVSRQYKDAKVTEGGSFGESRAWKLEDVTLTDIQMAELDLLYADMMAFANGGASAGASVFDKQAVEARIRGMLAAEVPADASDAWFVAVGEYCHWTQATPALRRAAIDRMVEVATPLEAAGKDALALLYRLKVLEYLTGKAPWGKLYAEAKAAHLGAAVAVPQGAACDADRVRALRRLAALEEVPADAERYRAALERLGGSLRGATSRAIAAGYAGKTAVLTGAASGMGRCCAETLAEAGATVFVCDVNAEGAKRVADAINARGYGRAYAVACDVRKFGDAERAAALAVKETGRIDLMVHWAGGYEPRMRGTNGVPFYEQPLEVLDWGIDVNLKGAVYFARACMPQMVKQQSGVLVCIGSVTGFEGSGCGAMYGTAKSGLYNFVKGLAKAGAPNGIRAFSVTPGPVMTRPGMAGMKTVLDRPSQPQELVDYVLYLASDSCPSVTGTNHIMDAGRLCLP